LYIFSYQLIKAIKKLRTLANSKSTVSIKQINNDFINLNKIVKPKYTKFLNIGIVTSISDNIVNILGLYNVSFGEMIEILTGIEVAKGMILNIEESKVSAVIFTSDINIKPGQEVVKKNILMSVPTGDNLLGRIVDPLDNPLHSNKLIKSKSHRFMDSMAPSIISRNL